MKDTFYNCIISGIEKKKNTTDEDIDDLINQFKTLPMFNVLSEDDILDIRNIVMANNSIKMHIGNVIENPYRYKKWFLNKKSELDMKYWDRYRKYLIKDKHFPQMVVDTMDAISDSLTDLLGDPSTNKKFQRRGLIIGDVQSGKTSNYTGLICKAADAGYKAVVVLTGTIEKLRKQTQMRIDEGFIGIDSDAITKQDSNDNIIGVGKYCNEEITPILLTTKTNDFKIQTAKNVALDLKSLNRPIVFVVKKNVSTLKNLNKWLKTFNKSSGDGQINTSLLMIDDESDNASINTNDEDKDPTSINKQIRELLNKFSKASYVGFTATPFANIFIDPETNDNMLKEDLFPKDYIYSLNPPSNYIGARDIFGEFGKYKEMCREIDLEFFEDDIPIAHKKDYCVLSIPKDLKESIRVFVLANVIRDLRGDGQAHRSMLINLSRFNEIQSQILNLVNTYLKSIQYSVKIFSKLDTNEAIKDNRIKELKDTFDKEYSKCGFDWIEIQKMIYKSIAPIQVLLVNQKSNVSLDYDEYEDGLRVIAIGGLSLSRGLTLEGLIVSYFCRNSKMYDTLMQMGRWFGYRNKYDDLCRIWMSDESFSWYKHISEATDELRDDIKKYQNSNLTPKDFGIRVRSDITSLLITARNKMRTADTIKRAITLSETVLETPYVYSDINKNKENKEYIKALIKEIESQGGIFKKQNEESKSSTCMCKGVSKKLILEFLDNIEISILNNFDKNAIRQFIENNTLNGLDEWDVAFIGGSSEKVFILNDENKINYVKRSFQIKKETDNKIIVELDHDRLGSSNDAKLGLTLKQIKQVEAICQQKNIPQKKYFQIERNPLLAIYMIELKDNKSNDKNLGEELKKKYENYNEPLIGFSVGIPTVNGAETVYVQYAINKIGQQNMYLDEFFEEGDE